jgi:hypothetical protein
MIRTGPDRETRVAGRLWVEELQMGRVHSGEGWAGLDVAKGEDMRRPSRRGAAALALMLLAGGQVHGPALAQDERPDLQIEVVGLKPGSQREVLVRVTNISTWWSQPAVATVEMVAPAAGNKVTTDVPDLNTKAEAPLPHQFEFTYALAADCKPGFKVKASLSAGANYEGVKETALGNNVHEREVCPASARPPDPGLGVPIDPNAPIKDVLKPGGPGNVVALIPEHKRPGLHGDGGPWPALVLEPSAARTAIRRTQSGPCAQFVPARDDLFVGWYQSEDTCWIPLPFIPVPFDDGDVQVAQTAVNFDLSKLDEVPNKKIRSAVLTFKETPSQWTSGGGGFEQKGGCVEVLGRATAPWEGRELNTLFPNEKVQGHTPGAREWYVTMEFDLWAQNLRPRHGFVLRGGNENPQGEDNTSCMSQISEIALKVTYEVPPN